MDKNQYVSEYKKRCRWMIVGLFSRCILYFFLDLVLQVFLALMGWDQNLVIFATLIEGIWLLEYSQSERYKCAHIIQNIYKSDMNIELALEVHRKLMDSLNRIEAVQVFNSYLELLLDIGEYDKFYRLYAENPKICHRMYLNKLRLAKCLSVGSDKEKYHKYLSSYKFTRYHKRKNRLVLAKERYKFMDNIYEVSRLYENKEYKKVMDRVKEIPIWNKYEELYFQSFKERAAYYLGEAYSVPDEKGYPFFFIKQWKTLVETGFEYIQEDMDKNFLMIEEYNRAGKKYYQKLNLIVLLFIVLSYIILRCTYI